MKKKIIVYLLLPFVFISCKSGSSLFNLGLGGLVALFVLMLLLFSYMFFLIARRKKQGERSLVKFNNDIQLTLAKLDTPEQQIGMLQKLEARILDDPKYKKEPEWQQKVLGKVYLHLATAYYHQGDQMNTINFLSKIIEFDANDAMAYYNRGSLYNQMGLYQKALGDLNLTIELTPDYASAYNNRGMVHYKMEHYQQAIADYEQAIALEDSPTTYYNRGNAYTELEKYDSAKADYQRALDLVGSAESDLRSQIKSAIARLV